MQRLHDYVPQGVEVYQLEYAFFPPSAQQDWLVLSDDERARALRLHKPIDRLRAIRTRAQLRRLLASKLDLTPQLVPIDYNAYGKPLLPEGMGLDFNVSHSAERGLIAVSEVGAVGVDIEMKQTNAALADIAPLLLHPDEQGAGELVERWVVKEACLKALGCGISEHLQSIAVHRLKQSRYQLAYPAGMAQQLQAWPIQVSNAYVAAIALVLPYSTATDVI
ncbi:4'-phosphopantetheinyl transferase superfamily protein [Deefgea rivuli]|uniref:4'-phosphopantetheinyl transferase superfamily protein n=1 Tax=Deefgea rivuli TaxID=400948 RepID=UPI000684AEFE|nr:4'-phosphopantetheinyl transferase superfamily protein [Deefgea rivuli]